MKLRHEEENGGGRTGKSHANVQPRGTGDRKERDDNKNTGKEKRGMCVTRDVFQQEKPGGTCEYTGGSISKH